MPRYDILYLILVVIFHVHFILSLLSPLADLYYAKYYVTGTAIYIFVR
jgi:hypothetical protein